VKCDGPAVVGRAGGRAGKNEEEEGKGKSREGKTRGTADSKR